MKQTLDNRINLYESYLQQTKKEQSSKSGKRITLILPLALLLLILLGISGKLLLNNMEKRREADALDAELATLSAEYDSALSLEGRRDESAATYESLSSARFVFTLYPSLTQDLFMQVRTCAAGIFNISQYAYEETTGMLTINASAASVNEVPLFVQRLRDTGLFSLVQYTGYTSKDTTEYFCTVGCTLVNENSYALTALLDAQSEETAEDTPSEAQDETAVDALQ